MSNGTLCNQKSTALDFACFPGLNLNYLMVFAALYHEKSATRAAARLNVGQPAVSNSLNKLRIFFKDQLFERAAGKMIATPKAEQIASRLMPILLEIQSILEIR